MPMDFPDMRSLEITGEIHKFRPPNEGELEKEYRQALHEHVKPKDKIESFEILFGIGWDKWTEDQNLQMLGIK